MESLTTKEENAGVQKGDEKPRRYATKTASYGYFPILDFIIPWRRRAKAIWLMDQYVEARSRYPKARFFYIGHSNGTLLLGHALKKYAGCRFERVVFAGSPLNRKFFRKELQGEIEKLLNYVATGDFVVGTFPKGMQWLSTDLGSAGHDGFLRPSGRMEFAQPTHFVRGGHGAAIVEDNWDAMALFIHAGNDHAISQDLTSKRRNPLPVVIGWFCVLLVVPLIIALFCGGLWLLVIGPQGMEFWIRGLIFVLVFILVVLFLRLY